MTTIIFLGTEKEFENSVIQYFLKRKSVIICKKEILISGNKYLINFDDTKNLNYRKSIYVFGGLKFKKTFKISDDSICICLGSNKDALGFLYKIKANVITCGFSDTDTLTFSSLEKKHIISLQRPIKNIKDQLIEPFEFINNFKAENDENILLLNCLKIILTQ